jgi:hypothetical protein
VPAALVDAAAAIQEREAPLPQLEARVIDAARTPRAGAAQRPALLEQCEACASEPR